MSKISLKFIQNKVKNNDITKVSQKHISKEVIV
jgi:hypothetical protein